MLTQDAGRLMEDAVVTEDPELMAEERIIRRSVKRKEK